MAGAFDSTEANELMQNTYEELHYFVKNLLGPGCYILASKPKLGKSFWTLQLGVSLVSGQPFMSTFETSKAGICLLQLEDGLKRAQRRLWLLADEIPKGMRIVEEAERLDTGLLDQIRRDLESHPETSAASADCSTNSCVTRTRDTKTSRSSQPKRSKPWRSWGTRPNR